jgi:hypothetical protein
MRTLNPTRLLAAALLALAAGAACAQTPLVTTAAPANVVNLSASATVEVPKDQLTIVFSTTREGTDAAVVQGQLKQALDAALAEARKAARPGQVDVQTGNFSLYPRYSPKGGTNGWTGTAELVVEGRDMPAISQLAGRIGTLTIARHCAVQPPSTCQATPRTLSPAAEHMNSASSASCSGVVNCSDGCFSPSSRRLASSLSMPAAAARASTCFCTSGVSTQPGQMALR